MLEDSDKVFEQMLTACAENPNACNLAQNRTAEELIDYAYQWFEDLKTNPVVLSLPTGDGFIVTFVLLKSTMFFAMSSLN